jgi:hypothetical protein
VEVWGEFFQKYIIIKTILSARIWNILKVEDKDP